MKREPLARGHKRVAIIADLHCGHRGGLTPPEFRYRESSEDHIWRKFTAIQDEAWRRYTSFVQRLNPITCLLVNGDGIDGRGERSGGVELLTGDRNEQCRIAEACIRQWEFDGKSREYDVVMAAGTPYHVGDIESWEHIIADMLRSPQNDDDRALRVKIGDHEWVDINGFVFDMKHHCGSSSVPYGRATAMKRAETWNLVWAEAGEQPRGDFFVRSHVHFCEGAYKWIGGKKVEAITTPALQTMGTRFGARRCEGTVNWGLLAFDISPQGNITTRYEWIVSLESTKAKALKV